MYVRFQFIAAEAEPGKKSQARKIEGFVKRQFFNNKFFNISGGVLQCCNYRN